MLYVAAIRVRLGRAPRGSQSKHTRSILIPRSVAVNVEAEAEYISQRRNEVSSLVNKHWARAGAWPGARAHPVARLQEFYFHDRRHVLNCLLLAPTILRYLQDATVAIIPRGGLLQTVSLDATFGLILL